MADDLKDEDIVTEEIENEPESTVDPIEALAAKAGWSPKDNWKGPEDDWKSAEQFLEATVAINKSQRNENKDLKRQMERLSNSVESVVDRVRAEERAKWQEKHSEAVDLGDRDAALAAADKIRELDNRPADSDTTKQFVDRNANWFNIDPLATAMAHNAAQLLAGQGKSAAEQVEYAERVVKERFPELFKSAEVKPLAQVAEPIGRMAANRTSSQKGFEQMPSEAKQACLMFEKKGVSRDSFVSEYWKGKA